MVSASQKHLSLLIDWSSAQHMPASAPVKGVSDPRRSAEHLRPTREARSRRSTRTSSRRRVSTRRATFEGRVVRQRRARHWVGNVWVGGDLIGSVRSDGVLFPFLPLGRALPSSNDKTNEQTIFLDSVFFFRDATVTARVFILRRAAPSTSLYRRAPTHRQDDYGNATTHNMH